MKRATKWLAFLVILAMVTAFVFASAASAMAWTWWWQPPEEEAPAETTVVEPPAETPPPVEETPAVEETATQTEPEEVVEPAKTGRIELVVWSDLNGNGVWDYGYDELTGPENELIDGIEVVLSRWEWIEDEDGNGAYGWAKKDVKTTGPGSLLNDPNVDYKHGCVVWEDLPLDSPYTTTQYKLDLVMDGTFEPLGDGYKIATLGPWQSYVQYFLPLASWNDDWNAPEINETGGFISGFVWSDANADQIIEWSEYSFFPLQGWTVLLTNSRGYKIATTVTDVHGYYYFRGLKPGTYKVWVQDRRFFNQTAPYYKIFTWPPWGYNKGHHVVYVEGTNRYRLRNFGMLDMRDSVWAPLYYALWLFGNLQYQFTW
jgi:hypothetical protein